MSTEHVLRVQRNLYEDAISWIAITLGLGNTLLGLVLLAMPDRINHSSSFKYVVTLAPAQAWGLVFCFGGILALVAQIRRKVFLARAAHTISCFLCVWWVVAFLIAGFNIPRVSVTGVLAYGMIAGIHAIIAAVSPIRDDLR